MYRVVEWDTNKKQYREDAFYILAILEQNMGGCVLFFIHVWRKDGFKGFISDTTLLDIFSDFISNALELNCIMYRIPQ